MLKKLLAHLGVQDRAGAAALFWQFFKFGLVGLSNTAVAQGTVQQLDGTVHLIFLFLAGPDPIGKSTAC